MAEPIVVAEARRWLGTPYHHQASCRGVGCDCLGLVRGVYAAVIGDATETPPPYTPDWAVTGGRDVLLEAAARHLMPIEPADAFAIGDVVAFRYRQTWLARHLAIVSAPDRMIHAYEGVGVIEAAITPWWRRRLAAAFRFPPHRSNED